MRMDLGDVVSPESVQSCVDAVVQRFGRIDILHNNAATKTSDPRQFFTPFEDYSLEVCGGNVRKHRWHVFDGTVCRATVTASSIWRLHVQTGSYGLVAPDSRIYEGSDTSVETSILQLCIQPLRRPLLV